jgi:hypothetical protein
VPLYAECDYWVIGYAEGDEECGLEGPFRGRKKKPKKPLPIPELPVKRRDDGLVMAIVRWYLENVK